MALRERIYSLETEYGIQFYPVEGKPRPSVEAQVYAVVVALRNRYGMATCDFIGNGSKIHQDQGHPEWALPECRSVREAVVYDRAADHAMQLAIPEAEAELARKGHRGRLVIFKNNADASGHTFGCHENYLMMRDAETLNGSSFQRYLVRCLTAFLVTRQLYCGAGRLALAPGAPPAFQLSQRAEFMEYSVTNDTTKNRAIVNLAREDEPHASARYRRLHLILGDANLSGWATWMKLGVTGLLLRLIEDLYLCDAPLLADPVAAIKQVASDLTGQQPLRLRDGKTQSALAIQWEYWRAASAYAAAFGASEEERHLLQAWEQTLADFEQDPRRLRDRADWAIKKNLMDARLRALGADWTSEPFPSEGLAALKGTEARYHDVSEAGLYQQMLARQQRADMLVTAAEIELAREEPPPFTRAHLRGQLVRRKRAGEFPELKLNWGELQWGNKSVKLEDPLDYFFPAEGRYARLESEAGLERGLASSSATIRRQAASYLGWSQTEAALQRLKQLLASEQDESVLCAALSALGRQGLETGRLLLLEYVRHPQPALRWTAEAALQGAEETPAPPAAVRQPPRATPSSDADHLVRLLS